MTSPDASAPPSATATPTSMLEYASAYGEQAIPLTAEHAHLLTQAGEYRSSSRLLRTSGIWDIVWGLPLCILGMVLFFVMGRRGGLTNVFPAILLSVGVIMLGVGVWLIVSPSPAGMLVDGAVLILLSGVNLFWIVRDFRHQQRGDDPHFVYIMVFVITLLAGIGRFRRFKRFARASRTAPPRATLDWLGQMLVSLKRTRLANDPEGFTFQSTNAWPPINCRGRLTPDLAMCSMNHQQMSFYSRDELQIDTQITAEQLAAKPRSKFKVKLTLGERTFNAMILPESLTRLQAWKDPPLMLDEVGEEEVTPGA